LPGGGEIVIINGFTEGCPSGQREQTVNLPVYAYAGSNPAPSTIAFLAMMERGESRK
jgi:hypothetical protein